MRLSGQKTKKRSAEPEEKVKDAVEDQEVFKEEVAPMMDNDDVPLVREERIVIPADSDLVVDDVEAASVPVGGGWKDFLFGLLETIIAVAVFGIVGYQLGGIYVSQLVANIVGG